MVICKLVYPKESWRTCKFFREEEGDVVALGEGLGLVLGTALALVCSLSHSFCDEKWVSSTKTQKEVGRWGGRHICAAHTRAATAVIDAAKKHSLDCELEECEIFPTKWS